MIKKIVVLCLVLMNTTLLGQTIKGKTNDLIIDYSKPSVKSVLPRIDWFTPAFESSLSQNNNISIDAIASSASALKEISLFVIDSENNIREKKIPIEAGLFSYKILQPIRLEDGQYTLKLHATNVTGGTIASSRSIIIGKDAISDAIAIDRKDYAILFATDSYDYWTDLVNPIYDANTIADELKEKFGFEVEIIENASQEDVFIKLADYAQRTYKSQDQLMIFFAGHGYYDDTFGEGFVVAKNSLENDRAKTSFISHNRLRSIINNIPCEHILLMMDVCFGGTFDPVVARERGTEESATADNEFIVRKLSYKSRKYLTSGGKTYVSDGVAGKHSPFAQRVLQAFKDRSGNDDILTLGELKTYMDRLVPEPRSGGFGDDNIASDFLFVYKGN